MRFVRVKQTISVHPRRVIRNVWLARNALKIRRVSIKSVLTHVPEPAALMHDAKSSITILYAAVRLDILVIRSSGVYKKVRTNIKILYMYAAGKLKLYYYFPLEPLYEPSVPTNPCVPSPCGPNSLCRDHSGTPACSCLSNYIGRPPNCRPECTINAECPGNLACVNEKCRDPCPGSCGIYATCNTVKHVPQCVCQNGYTGDPFSGCSLVQQSKTP